MDGIHSAETDLGTVLVDSDGFTVYVFTADVGGEPTCYDSCANNWPAVPADTAIGTDLDASLFGSVSRTDGPDQLTVNGQPLYTYAPDSQPGDTKGQGVGGAWFVVDVSGAMVGNPEASVDDGATTTSDDGLDY
jgi:predicted lipoprotein with Yx(FWY)xxD motif